MHKIRLCSRCGKRMNKYAMICATAGRSFISFKHYELDDWLSSTHLLLGALILGEKPVVIYNYIQSTLNNMAFIRQVFELRLIAFNPHALELKKVWHMANRRSWRRRYLLDWRYWAVSLWCGASAPVGKSPQTSPEEKESKINVFLLQSAHPVRKHWFHCTKSNSSNSKPNKHHFIIPKGNETKIQKQN